MTKQEAVEAFRAQAPVVVLKNWCMQVRREIYCRRIAELHYRMELDGTKGFRITAEEPGGHAAYSGPPECFRLATEREITDQNQNLDQ